MSRHQRRTRQPQDPQRARFRTLADVHGQSWMLDARSSKPLVGHAWRCRRTDRSRRAPADQHLATVAIGATKLVSVPWPSEWSGTVLADGLAVAQGGGSLVIA